MSRTRNTAPMRIQIARALRRKHTTWKVWNCYFNEIHNFGPYGIVYGGVNRGIKQHRKFQTRRDRARVRDELKKGNEDPMYPETRNASWDLH